MDDMTTIKTRFAESLDVIKRSCDRHVDTLCSAAGLLVESYKAGGGVFLFGNGGSAADAQHIAGELVGRFLLDRRGLKAHALTVDTSVITCLTNDYNYDMIFARQLEANATAGDVAIGLSGSGNSPNVVAALKYARENGMKTIAFTGDGGGESAMYADILLDAATTVTCRAQEAHIVMYHTLCELVERSMAGMEA